VTAREPDKRLSNSATNTERQRGVPSEKTVPAESLMPTQEELAFIKAIAPMIVEEMRKTLAAGGKGHTRPAEKRKATELAFSADSPEPATRRPATGAGPTPLKQHSSDAWVNKSPPATGNSSPPRAV
jgi:hypothetical protein